MLGGTRRSRGRERPTTSRWVLDRTERRRSTSWTMKTTKERWFEEGVRASTQDRRGRRRRDPLSAHRNTTANPLPLPTKPTELNPNLTSASDILLPNLLQASFQPSQSTLLPCSPLPRTRINSLREEAQRLPSHLPPPPPLNLRSKLPSSLIESNPSLPPNLEEVDPSRALSSRAESSSNDSNISNDTFELTRWRSPTDAVDVGRASVEATTSLNTSRPTNERIEEKDLSKDLLPDSRRLQDSLELLRRLLLGLSRRRSLEERGDPREPIRDPILES